MCSSISNFLNFFYDKDDDECDDEDYEDDDDVDDDADVIEEGCYHMMPRKQNCRHLNDSQVSHDLSTFSYCRFKNYNGYFLRRRY